MVLEPRHKVESKLIVVEIEAAVLPRSGPAPPGAPPAFPADPPGVVPGLGIPEELEVFKEVFSPGFLPPEALESLFKSSVVSPCSASGCGSTFFRMNRSAREAKHFNAPSDTCWSSDLSRELRHSTQEGRHSLCGSIFVHSLKSGENVTKIAPRNS
jgi:hypothetical protein